MKLMLFLLLILPGLNLLADDTHNYRLDLEEGRKYYYTATEQEEFIEKALKKFYTLKSKKDYKGLATTYIGSLTALRATYTIFPHRKLSFAKDGIKIMEEGIKQDPDNLESLFIYGSTCYYLPFFFGKSDEANNAFKKIINLAAKQPDNIDLEIIKNALEFILDKADLTYQEKNKTKDLLKKYSG